MLRDTVFGPHCLAAVVAVSAVFYLIAATSALPTTQRLRALEVQHGEAFDCATQSMPSAACLKLEAP